MRITMIIGGLTGGGAERVCVNLANAWTAGGRHNTILTIAQNSKPPVYPIDPRVDWRDVGWPRRACSRELNPVSIAPVLRGLELAGCFDLIEEITLIAMLRHAILETNPDIVVAHIDMTNVRVLAAMYETGVPVIACEHTDLNQVYLPRWQAARQALYRRAAAVVAPHATIARWLARCGAAAYAIPNPLFTRDRFRSSEGTSDAASCPSGGYRRRNAQPSWCAHSPALPKTFQIGISKSTA